jgi:hypothetical protein
MCTPSIPKDTSADQAAAANATRQANITAGQGNIDSAFSKFDDGYFNKYNQSYQDNYNPRVDDQFKIAQTGERYNAARKGTLDSTPAIYANDQLNKSYGDQKQQIASNANTATDTMRNTVQQQKTSLYNLNSSAADPTLAATNATAAAGTIPSTPQYSMLGDLFGGLVNAGAGVVQGQNSYNPYFMPGQGLPGSGLPGSGLPSANGSSRVVR